MNTIDEKYLTPKEVEKFYNTKAKTLQYFVVNFLKSDNVQFLNTIFQYENKNEK